MLVDTSSCNISTGQFFTTLNLQQYTDVIDFTGTVTAEVKNKDIESFLHHHFPANDVPKNVRDNFFKVLYRYIPNKDCKSVDITPISNELNESLVLADARCIADVHVKYLGNMGVKMALSIPVIMHNKLWGIVACQNKQPTYYHPSDRVNSRLLVDNFSMQVALLEAREKNRRQQDLLELNNELEEQIKSFNTLPSLFKKNGLDLNKKMDTLGFAAYIEGEMICVGKTPSKSEIKTLYNWLIKKGSSYVIQIDDVVDELPEASSYTCPVYGALLVRFLKTDLGFVMFFRDEFVKSITWAGNPDELIKIYGSKSKYYPRSSFSSWRQTVKGKSKPWEKDTVDFAEMFRQVIADKWLQLMLHEKLRLDHLTKVYNRSYLDEYINNTKKERRKNNLPISVAMLDIDDFKKLNDTYGHPFGDRVLKEIASIFKHGVRAEDIVCRYGGEEFLAVLESCSQDMSKRIMQKVLDIIRNTIFKNADNKEIRSTASIGISILDNNKKALTTIIKEADNALYEAKSLGKDRVVVYNPKQKGDAE